MSFGGGKVALLQKGIEAFIRPEDVEIPFERPGRIKVASACRLRWKGTLARFDILPRAFQNSVSHKELDNEQAKPSMRVGGVSCVQGLS